MYHKKFQVGDKVQYVGQRFAKELQGKLGLVVGRVGNSDCGVVCMFGDKDYVMDENRHLTHFQGKLPEEGVEVSHRGKGEDEPEIVKQKTGRGRNKRRRVVDTVPQTES